MSKRAPRPPRRSAPRRQDAYDRLIFPSIEREIRSELTERASDAAIKVFSLNLRHLLMQPPVKGKVALGLDPGYRTGCKTAVVDGSPARCCRPALLPRASPQQGGGGQAGW